MRRRPCSHEQELARHAANPEPNRRKAREGALKFPVGTAKWRSSAMSGPHTSSYDVQLCISLLRATPTFRLTSRKGLPALFVLTYGGCSEITFCPTPPKSYPAAFRMVACGQGAQCSNHRTVFGSYFCELAKGHTQNDQASRANASTRGWVGSGFCREYRQREISGAHPDLCTASTR
jgi:hypothetical protein